MRSLHAVVFVCLGLLGTATVSAQGSGGQNTREDLRTPEALQVLQQLNSALNPNQLPMPVSLVLTATDTKHGGDSRTFSQTITSPATFSDERDVSATVRSLRTPIQDLERRPLLPFYLLAAAQGDPRTGLQVQHGSGSDLPQLILFVHTQYWHPGLQNVGTARISLSYDPQTLLVTCEQSLFHFTNDYRSGTPVTTCYSNYFPESGIVLPHTLERAVAGGHADSITIQSVTISR